MLVPVFICLSLLDSRLLSYSSSLFLFFLLYFLKQNPKQTSKQNIFFLVRSITWNLHAFWFISLCYNSINHYYYFITSIYILQVRKLKLNKVKEDTQRDLEVIQLLVMELELDSNCATKGRVCKYPLRELKEGPVFCSQAH